MSRATLVVLALLAGLVAGPAGASTLVVTTTNDLVNGDTSSPGALVQNPGPDGISLREAILAANAVPGPRTIAFAPALAGQIVILSSPLPPISRDQVTLTGLTTGDGQPNITIDASHATGIGPTIWVGASSFTMTGMRFVFIPHDHAVQIGGAHVGIFTSSQRVANVDIRRNAFSHAAGTTDGFAISVKHSGVTPEGLTNNATISGVFIAENTFDDMFLAIGFAAGGHNNVIEDVVIYGNTFSRLTFRSDGSPIEVAGSDGSNNLIRRTRVLQNVFANNLKGIDLNNNDSGQPRTTSGNLVDDTLIARNVFMDNHSDIQFEGGVSNAAGNTIANTKIFNNLFIHTGPSIGIAIGDNDQGATDNRVAGVSIVNNTIYDLTGGGVGVASSGGVTGVTIVNTILGNGGMREITPEQVHFSITSEPGFAGINGNIAADPKFVNPAQGDFHLQAGSPAIDAGSSDGAPTADLECRSRVDDPGTPNTGGGALPYFDIGAYEFKGGPPACSPDLSIGTSGVGFRTGDVLTVSVGVENEGLAAVVDFYFGALLPDGDTVVFFTDLAFHSGVGSLAKPATLRPIVAGVDLTTPFTFSQPTFFTYTWTGGELPGPYLIFVAAVKAGTLADNSIDASDIIAVSTGAVSFAP